MLLTLITTLLLSSTLTLPPASGEPPQPKPAFEHLQILPETLQPHDARRIIVAGRGDPPQLKERVAVTHRLTLDDGFIAFGRASPSTLLTQTPGVKVLPDIKLDFKESRAERLKSLHQEAGLQLDMFQVRGIIGATSADSHFDVTGRGSTIAIVDSGVDFSHPDLRDALARDARGRPVMLDADLQGLVLTELTFHANITDGRIEDSSEIRVNATGVWLNLVDQRIPIWYAPAMSRADARSRVDWGVGSTPTNFIRSASGVYHFGVMFQYVHLYQNAIPYPLLLVDSHTPGLYDTVYIDLSYVYRILRGQTPDFSFYDEPPHHIGDGSEYLARDFTGDGLPDISAGVLGAHFLDPLGAVSDSETKRDELAGYHTGGLLPPLDPKGDYLNIMHDWVPHGTLLAAAAAGRGSTPYLIYENQSRRRLPGVAPDAKVIPVTALWLGDVVYGWLWSAGFEYQPAQERWVYTGDHRAEVISNSWGFTPWTDMEAGVGLSIIDLVEDALSLPGFLDPEYPGSLFVHAAGNSGYGYGTAQAASLALSVGASTSWHWLGSLPSQSAIPPSDTFDDVMPFSSRGPISTGEAKPDLVNVGAFALLPSSLYVSLDGASAYDLFGGTSLSTPLTAGAAALVAEALKYVGTDFDPFLVKSILMSTAKDLGYDPLVQGAGRVDAFAAVASVMASSSKPLYRERAGARFTASTNATYENLRPMLTAAAEKWLPRILEPPFPELSKEVNGSSWFAGWVKPGDAVRAAFTVANPSLRTINVTAEATRFNLLKTAEHSGATNGTRRGSLWLNVTEALGGIPEEAELAVFRLTYPFTGFWKNETQYGSPLNTLYLHLADWDDADQDEAADLNEMRYLSLSVNDGTAQEVRVSRPGEKFLHTPALRILQWEGESEVPFTIRAYYYRRDAHPWFTVLPSSFIVHPQRAIRFEAVLNVPDDAPSGLHQASLTLRGDNGQKVQLPVTFHVLASFKKDLVVRLPGGSAEGEGPYDPARFAGAFDWAGSFESGDTRLYSFEVQEPYVNAITLKVEWAREESSFDIYVLDEAGGIVATTSPDAWNWMGTGVFRSSANAGPNATLIAIPIAKPGLYTILVHNTLSAGEALEPLSINGLGFALLPDNEPPQLHVAPPPEYASGVVAVNYSATDQHLHRVLYAIDNEGFEELSGEPIAVDTTALPDGQHIFTVMAVDFVNHVSRVDHVFTVDNTPPTASFEGPRDGSIVAGRVPLTIMVHDANLAGAAVTLPEESVNVTGMDVYEWDTNPLPDELYALSLRVEDRAGNTAHAQLSLTVDNTPPLVRLLSPDEGAKVNGTVNISFKADDPHLNRVLLRIDNSTFDVTGLTEYLWDSALLADGAHSIAVTAVDEAGNSAEAGVGVSTFNALNRVRAAEEASYAKGESAGYSKGYSEGEAAGLQAGWDYEMLLGVLVGAAAAGSLVAVFTKRKGEFNAGP